MLTEFGAQLVESLILEDQIHRLTENVALGNPVDCEDFEVGILCNGNNFFTANIQWSVDTNTFSRLQFAVHELTPPLLFFVAQCPCKSKHTPERKQQHQRPETDNLSDSHLETGGMILQGMEPPYHGGVVAGHSNGDSNAEYANHNPESNQEGNFYNFPHFSIPIALQVAASAIRIPTACKILIFQPCITHDLSFP